MGDKSPKAAHNQTRKTLLFVVVPLNLPILFWDACLRHFPAPGSLNDWRDSVISHHIFPRNNPEFHSDPSFGMAITGLLLIPFVGYINRRLRVASQLGANIGLRRGVARVISDKVPVYRLSHLKHRDNFLAIEYRQQLFVCVDVALILGILELVFANVLPKLFGRFAPGEWVVCDHCGKRGVGLHGFAKGVFGKRRLSWGSTSDY